MERTDSRLYVKQDTNKKGPSSLNKGLETSRKAARKSSKTGIQAVERAERVQVA